MNIIDMIGELHKVWWKATWFEIAWNEHGQEPVSFVLTIRAEWDKFNMMAEVLKTAGIDMKALVVEFEASGDPKGTIPIDYATMLGRAKCAC
jgi:hypothetical protein